MAPSSAHPSRRRDAGPHTEVGQTGEIPKDITPKHLKAGWFLLCVHFQKLVPISFWNS